MSITKTITPADLKSLGNLQLLARSVVEGLNTGTHRSPDKGASIDFKQHRPYVPGDDLRNLDWKVFAKSDRFYIREYEEQTNLRATILLDHSGSMGYRPQMRSSKKDAAATSKHEYAVRLAACLAYLIISQGDCAGLMTFDTQVRSYTPPRGRPGHVGVLLDQMAQAVPGGETDLGRVLRDASPKIKRRGMVILISDCFGDVNQLMHGLAHFGRSSQDIMLFQIWDREELTFPFKRWHRFESLENPADRKLLDPAQLRKAYLQQLEKFRTQLKAGCRKRRIDHLEVVTDEPYAQALAGYLAHRQYRDRSGTGGASR